MAADELARTAGELIAASGAEEMAVQAVELVKNAGGYLAKEAGKIGLGILIKNGIEELARRIKEAKDKGEIPKDFESTVHGATLLQEALNALLEGLDHERAEAVKKVFLGLAMIPVEDSLEQVQQIEVMRITSTLTTWEVVLLNGIERYSNEAYNPISADSWSQARTPGEQQQVRDKVSRNMTQINAWLETSLCKRDSACFLNIEVAWEALHKKHILRRQFNASQDTSIHCVYDRQGAFTDFGWKLAVHLYSASEDNG